MAFGWYVAAIQRGKETALRESLARHGVEVYSPDITVVKRGRKLHEPLFPAYVFCQMDPQSELWPQLRWSKGIKYFLGADRQPTPVDDALVAEIRNRVAHWNGEGWLSAFQPGQLLRIGDGPLSGLDAIFSRYLPGRQRCEILVSLVGRTLTLQVSVMALEPKGATSLLA